MLIFQQPDPFPVHFGVSAFVRGALADVPADVQDEDFVGQVDFAAVQFCQLVDDLDSLGL